MRPHTLFITAPPRHFTRVNHRERFPERASKDRPTGDKSLVAVVWAVPASCYCRGVLAELFYGGGSRRSTDRAPGLGAGRPPVHTRARPRDGTSGPLPLRSCRRR